MFIHLANDNTREQVEIHKLSWREARDAIAKVMFLRSKQFDKIENFINRKEHMKSVDDVVKTVELKQKRYKM